MGQLVPPVSPLPQGQLIDSAYDFVQCCVPEQSAAAAWLEQSNFCFVDTRIVLRGPVVATGGVSGPVIRRARPDDLPALAFCDGIFTEDSRFWFGHIFPRAAVDGFYRTWIANSIEGTHDDACFIAQHDETACGLVTVKQVSASTMRMGLMGIAPAAQGQGVGSALTRFCMDYAAQHGCSIMEAITEGRNTRTQHFHQKNGLAVAEIYRWYYWTRSTV